MRTPEVQWTTPAPAWAGLAAANNRPEREAFQQPAILRFANDTFMEEFIQLLSVNPPGLPELWAQPETWRKPMAAPPAPPSVPAFAMPMHQQRFLPAKNGAHPRAAAIVPAKTPITEAARKTKPKPETLKLYQPAHGRFYLVSACLVCRLPGLPDRWLNSAEQEKVYFVVRRLKPQGPNFNAASVDTSTEYAYVAAPGGNRWIPVPNESRRTLMPGEEPNPLFPVSYNEAGRGRRLFSGLIPVARREAYLGAGMSVPTGEVGSEAAPDPRRILLRMSAIEPWQRLLDQVNDTNKRLTDPKLPQATGDDVDIQKNDRAESEKALRDHITAASWYVLVDLNLFFEEHLPNLYDRIKNATSTVALSPAETTLLTRLNQFVYRDLVPPTSTMTLLDALRRVVRFTDALDAISTPYKVGDPQWPDFFFNFADPDANVSRVDFPTGFYTPTDVEDLIVSALVPTTAALPDLPLGAKPLPDAGDPGWFIVRCVFECPQCGPVNPPLVSQPTDVFQMANFFDPDAPARPIRISMPIDTSPAGLRKFAKNTSFVVSDILACQMEKAGGLTLGDLVLSVLPWPFHKGLPDTMADPCAPSLDLGKLCTLSIPIITICAFILLLIIVSLFDIIFHWLPYLIICFPLPGLKAKKQGA